jgi:hypothetical protein
MPALSATRSSRTVDDAIKAATLEVPGPVASAAANDMSSIVTERGWTPVTKSAYADGGAVTCALCPTYDQMRLAEPAAHDRPLSKVRRLSRTGGYVTASGPAARLDRRKGPTTSYTP